MRLLHRTAEPTATEPDRDEDLVDEPSDNDRIIESLHRSQAVIEFEPDGTILDANQNFLDTLGNRRDEIVGRHHRIFVDPAEAETEAYREFWQHLAEGCFQTAEYRRTGKGGKDVWIQATYNPVPGIDGAVEKVIKLATDITRQKVLAREIQDRSQAVIEFEPDGTIVSANQLFLDTVGHALGAIQGRHHRIFMPPGRADTEECRKFWPPWSGASSSRASSSGSTPRVRNCGSREPTTRCSASTARWSGWSRGIRHHRAGSGQA